MSVIDLSVLCAKIISITIEGDARSASRIVISVFWILMHYGLKLKPSGIINGRNCIRCYQIKVWLLLKNGIAGYYNKQTHLQIRQTITQQPIPAIQQPM